MHNLHLARIKAKSHDDACAAVLSYMEGWGDENNWRSAGGAICEDGTGETYDDFSRWPVIEDEISDQIEHLNTSCFGTLQSEAYLNGHLSERLKEVLNMSIEEMLESSQCMKFYTARRFFWFLSQTHEARQKCKESYDIFNSPEFYAYDYGEFGLTDFGNNGYKEEELKECKTYIVLIDMHT